MGVFAVALFLASVFMTFSPVDANAQTTAPLNAPLGIYNVIQRVEIVGGELVAYDNLNNPLELNLTSPGRIPGAGRPPGAPGQGGGNAAACPILNLELGPIELNLLGLLVEISDICLDITAHPSQGLLGNLLCGIARLLDRGISLDQILGNLSMNEQAILTDALRDILNGALNNLNIAEITDVGSYDPQVNGIGTQQVISCQILFLALGPLDLNILGLRVELDDCNDGPVEITITALPGQGLLGDLLCGLLGGLPDLGNLIGLTLQELLNQLLELLPIQPAP
jgi:hypothetical protein